MSIYHTEMSNKKHATNTGLWIYDEKGWKVYVPKTKICTDENSL